MLPTIARSGSSVPTSAARRASVSASARAALGVERAARGQVDERARRRRSTTTNTTRASKFSPCEIVHVWMGGVKNQLASRKPATAATTPGTIPPIAPTVDDEEQEEQQHRFEADVVAHLDEREREQGEADPGEHPTDDLTPPRQRRTPGRGGRRDGSRSSASAGSWEITCTSIGTGEADRAVDDRAADHFGPARSAARAEHELGAVLGPREFGERGGNVARDDLVVLAAEIGEQLAVAQQVLRRRSGESVRGRHVEAEELAVGALGHAGGAANQRLGARRTGDRDEHPLARLPRLGDPVAFAVLAERFVDSIRDPQQREFAQRRQVAGPEVVPERGVDLLGLVDVAVGHAAAQRLG